MVIYTDGSCTGNGKAVNSGGFGVVVLDNHENLVYTYSKRPIGDQRTTVQSSMHRGRMGGEEKCG